MLGITSEISKLLTTLFSSNIPTECLNACGLDRRYGLENSFECDVCLFGESTSTTDENLS